MTQTERRLYLISELLKEQPRYEGMKIPESEDGQKRLLRSLFNIRMPRTASQEFACLKGFYGHTGRIFTTGDQAAWDCIPW